MTKERALLLLALLASISVASFSWSIAAYAHGVPTGFIWGGGFIVRDENEQFSNNLVDMNDGNGGVVSIIGTLKNVDSTHEIKLAPYISVDSIHSNPTNSFELNYYLLRTYYSLYNDPASWYFRIETNLTNPIILKPNSEVNYEIKAYPLKAGSYHLHSLFIFDGISLRDSKTTYYYETVGRGQTVDVKGSSTPTTGEITQLYLPLASGMVAMALLVTKAVRNSKYNQRNSSNNIRAGIRIYFAIKSSVETVWLVGLLSWFIFAAYPTFNQLEARFSSLLIMISVIAAITIGGYIATIIKSRKIQNIASIVTAGATALFYYFLIFATSVSSLPYSGIGYRLNQFDIDATVGFIAIIANVTIVAIMAFLWIREERQAAKLASRVSNTEA